MTRLPKYACTNFETLARAFAAGHVALVACTDRATRAIVPTICAVEFDGDAYTLKPLASLFTDNPYDVLDPP